MEPIIFVGPALFFLPYAIGKLNHWWRYGSWQSPNYGPRGGEARLPKDDMPERF